MSTSTKQKQKTSTPKPSAPKPTPVASGKKPKPPPPSKKAAPKREPIFDPNCAINPIGWERSLRVNKTKEGGYKKSTSNVLVILTNHPSWRGMFAYDEFIGDIVTTRPPKWPEEMAPETTVVGEWTEEDMGRLRMWIDRYYGLDMDCGTLSEIVRVLARKKTQHHVRDTLLLYKWDGKVRIDDWLIRLAGADDTEYVRAVSARYLIGAVARVLKREKKPGVDPGGPGCKHDCMPVFEGKTGLRKSSMLKALFGPEFFGDTMFDLNSKDSYQVLKGKWAYEFAELSHFDKKSMEDIKSFISSSVDRYRPSYGHKAADFPRQCIFAGTTEDERWHRDDRGGRRFWPVRLHGVGSTQKIDIKGLELEREQLWAEAVVRFKADAQWYLDTPELEKLAAEEIDKRRQIDPLEEDVAKLLGQHEADFLAKRLRADLAISWRVDGVGMSDILDGLGLDGGYRNVTAAIKIGAVMRLLGWYRYDHGNEAIVRYKYYPNGVLPPAKLALVKKHEETSELNGRSGSIETSLKALYKDPHTTSRPKPPPPARRPEPMGS